MDAQPVPTDPESDLPPFARGFLLTAIPTPSPVAAWITGKIAGLWLSRAADVPLTTARVGRHVVLVLGRFVDTEAWCPMDLAVARAADALARSEDAFLDLTDAWAGRYLVVFGDADSRHVMTDATGLRAAFHALDGPFVLASHASIVARVVGASRWRDIETCRATMGRQGGRRAMALPGRATPWTGVVHLTANMALDVATRSLRRIHPRRPIPPMTPAAVAAIVAPRLRGQVTALVGSGRPLAMSITAGVDSRVSLAASRPVRDGLDYFTYRRADLRGNAADISTARAMARTLGLAHRVLDVPPSLTSPQLAAAMDEAAFLSHGRRIVPAYRAAFTPQTLHIRSNIGEVGRAYYRRTPVGAALPVSAADLTAEDLARLWGHGEVDAPAVDAFGEWMAATAFRDATGRDALDLLYWEYRMPCWHGNVVLESDFAFDTHVLFNARWILDRFLAVPLDDRLRGTVFRLLVDGLWPELGRWPTERRARRVTLGSIRRRVSPRRRR